MSLRHHSLIAWQRADDLFVRLHQLSLKAFPSFERYELGSQLRRAAFSVPVNIVEGFARPKGRGRVNFLKIAQASLAEVGYCIHVAQRLGYLSEDVARELETEVRKVGGPLAGVIRMERLRVVAPIGGAIFAVVCLAVLLA